MNNTRILLCIISMLLNGYCYAQIMIPLGFTNLSSTPATNMEENNGTITASWKGGAAPYVVSVVAVVVAAAASAAVIAEETTLGSSLTFPGLMPGTYQVTVTDSSVPQQTITGQIAVGQPGAPLTSLNVAVTNAACSVTGSIQATVTPSQTAGVTFTLTPPTGTPITNTTGTFTGLTAGTFTITATATQSPNQFSLTGTVQINNIGITSSTNPIVNFIITKYCGGCLIA